MTAAELHTARVAELAAESLEVRHPMRRATWVKLGEATELVERFEDRGQRVAWQPKPHESRPDVLERAAELRSAVRRLGAPLGVHVAVEGVCRAIIGSAHGGMRGDGERVTVLVVHVTADGEPARSVLLPLEETRFGRTGDGGPLRNP